MKNQKPTAIIVGATSPIGRAVAKRLASEGHPLIVASRDHIELKKIANDIAIRHQVSVDDLPIDLEKTESHASFVQNCEKAAKDGLSSLILCAGFMADQKDSQEQQKLRDHTTTINYTGTVSLIETFAPLFEKQGNGTIAAISSVAGDRGRFSNYIYGSSKAAINTYLSGLRCRLWHSGAHVLNVKPGFVDTKMTWGKVDSLLIATPEKVAQDLCKGLQKQSSTIYSPFFWRYIMWVVCAIPQEVFKRLKM